MMKGRDFCEEQSRISWQQVKIFMMKGQGIYHDRSRIAYYASGATARLLVTRVSFIYLVGDFFFLFLV